MSNKMDKLTFHTVELARSFKNSLNLEPSLELSEDSDPEQAIQYIMRIAVAVRDYYSDQPDTDFKYKHIRVLKNLERLLYHLELKSGGKVTTEDEGLLTALASTSLHLLLCMRRRE